MTSTSKTTMPTPVTWREVDELLTGYGAQLRHRRRGNRVWNVPARAGGTFQVEVTLRPRWCSIGIDRWHTTDHPPDSEAWFTEHIWPAVEAAHQARRSGCAYLPTGRGVFTSAYPIERSDLLDVLARWVEAELTW